MGLVILTMLVFACMLLLQQVPGGYACDVVTPLMTTVGLVVRRDRAFWWAVLAGMLYAAFTRLHPLAVAGTWWALVLVLRAVARGVEWERPPLAFLVAVLVSLAWQMIALLFGIVLDMLPTVDSVTWYSFVLRPLTAGLLFMLFFHPLLRLAQPVRFARTR